jgi:hypothetical protein
MTRRISRFVLLCALALSAVPAAAAATIVSVSGDVKVRVQAAASWQAAQKGQAVEKEAEIQCGPDGRCTVALDETLTNTVAVKENTTVAVEGLGPGRIYLKEGRVFSIIPKAVSGQESFQVRTPTSVSGARGTAWLTDFRTGRTEVSVFEDSVSVSGIDQAGNVTGFLDVATGHGVSVAADGLLGEVFVVSAEQINEWYGQKQELQALRQAAGLPASPDGEKAKAEEGKAASGAPAEEPRKSDAAAAEAQAAAAGAGTVAAAGQAVADSASAQGVVFRSGEGRTGQDAPAPMSQEDELLAQIQKARLETQRLLDGQDTTGPETGAPFGATMMPESPVSGNETLRRRIR